MSDELSTLALRSRIQVLCVEYATGEGFDGDCDVLGLRMMRSAIAVFGAAAGCPDANELAAYKLKLVMASIADNLQHNGQPTNNDLRIWKLVLGQALKDLQGE